MKKRKSFPILHIVGKVLLTLIFIIVITVILSIAAAVIAVRLNPDLIISLEAVTSDSFFIKGSLWAQIVGFVSGVYFSFYIFERKKGWSLGLHTLQFGRRLSEGFVWGVALITISSMGIWLFGGIRIVNMDLSLTKAHAIGGSFLLFVGVALNEELFARGYLQGIVKHRFGPKVAVGVSTIVFALLHSFNPGMWGTPFPFINILLAGLLMGLCREFTGSLWMPIGLHLAWNFMQGCVFGFDVSGIPMTSFITTETEGALVVSGGAFGAEGSLITSVILVLGIIMIYNYYQTRIRFNKTVQINKHHNLP
ncbi:type II CAAX endopeptidase family protein [Paenibacillus qinlingensis]|uniref:Membrane protease YdiL (CAAX protease family) n=1 Tax=Paenibacillus qinlingensis TaxID=1837343 RepID=A0ABU1NPB9_9BACL|nr:type II CAAX endopeptidase family protein [Paenibacillus qinlingensis]MDR6549318.1 membrane protease YdiL (CAAX protease family) [Paenibacillus qinlingensis]